MTEMEEIVKKAAEHGITVHSYLMLIHTKAIACHCECLGMNAENVQAMCGNYPPPYHDGDYFSTMEKWGLMTEKGKPKV